MSKLIFNAEEVRRVVEHSIGRPQSEKLVDYDTKTMQPITKPLADDGVILVHDHGVYLMSNAKDGDKIDPSNPNSGCYVAYAKGCNPTKDADCHENSDLLGGGDDFGESLPWAKQIKQRIDGGAKSITIQMTASSIRLV